MIYKNNLAWSHSFPPTRERKSYFKRKRQKLSEICHINEAKQVMITGIDVETAWQKSQHLVVK